MLFSIFMIFENRLIGVLVLLGVSLVLSSYNLAFGDLQNEVDIFFGKGEKAFGNQEFEKAISYYDKVLELEPTHVDSLFKKGGTLLILEKSDEAIEMFDKVLEIDPNHIGALSFKADELVKQGKSQEASSLYERILEIEPEHSGALSFKANELAQTGKINDAITLYEKVLSIEPKGSDPLGVSYADRLLEIDPNNPDALSYKGNSLVLLERSSEGNTIIFGNKLDEAISYFDKALLIEPDNIDALFNKGRALIQKVRAAGEDENDPSKLDEGMSYIDRVLELNPNHVGALNFKADELVRFEKNDLAIPIIDKVLKMEPNNEEALFLKGRTFFIDEDWTNSTTYFDKVLHVNPHNKIAKTNFHISAARLGYLPIDGYVDVKIHDSEGRLVSNIQVTNLKLLNHEIGTNLIDEWPMIEEINRDGNQYVVRQSEKNIDVQLQYVFGGASHYGIMYPYEDGTWLLYGNYWQYYVDKGDTVTFVYTAFIPLV